MGDEGRRCGQGAIAASDQIFERIVFGCVCVVCAVVCVCVDTHVCVCVLFAQWWVSVYRYIHACISTHKRAHAYIHVCMNKFL